jgi:predicted DNA-binding protein
MRPKARNPTVSHVTFRMTEEKKAELEKLAAKRKMPVSELIREFIDKGLSVQGYSDDIDFIRRNIREELKAQLAPAVDRLVKLTVKSGIVSAAGYFLNASALSEFVHPSRQREFEETLAESKKLGIYYFRLPSNEAAEFLKEDGKLKNRL